MKRKVKHLTLLLTLIMSLSIFSIETFANSNEINEMLIAEFGEKFLDNMVQAHINDDKLMELFNDEDFQKLAKTKHNFLEDILETAPAEVSEKALEEVLGYSADKTVYPDFVGGIYYNSHGYLVLQIVEDMTFKNKRQYARVEKLVAKLDDIVVKYVEHPQNELSATIDYLNALFLSDDKPEAFENIDSYGEHTSTNSISMYVYSCKDKKIAQFKETVLDSDIVTFIKTDEPSVAFFLTVEEEEHNILVPLLIVAGVITLSTLSILLWRKKSKQKSKTTFY